MRVVVALTVGVIAVLACLSIGGIAGANETPAKEAVEPKKFPEWDTVIKGAEKKDGLFPLYFNEKEQKLFMEIASDKLNRDLICPIAIARGAGFWYLGGDTLNVGDQWVLSFRRGGDRIHVIRRNTNFRAKEGSPQADAVRVSYNDSVVAAIPIRSERGGSVLVDLADLFMTDLAGLGIRPDPSRSTWGKIKNFEQNVEVEVSAVFSLGLGGDYFAFFDREVPDSRGAQIVIHYGLSMVPTGGNYKPRVADDRVGHFLSVIKDYSTDYDNTPFVRYVTRWHLEKADPAAEMSPAKEPIIFWIEKSVPREYRRYVKEGILEWNKAFEKIGFIEAIQVRDQQSEDDFEPEDIRYNTFRWIATSSAFAMGPSRTNPTTGQILDADILFDEAMVRYWRQDYLRTQGLPQGLQLLRDGQHQAWFKHYAAEMPWITLAEPILDKLVRDPSGLESLVPKGSRSIRTEMGGLPQPSGRHTCMLGPGMTRQLGLIAAVLRAEGKAPGGKVPEEFIGQAIREVTMHEVGHTLGLRHNFKASGMLSLADCNNTDITSKKGMAGSVMDYLPANIARKGEKQGHYFSPTIGPYDYWAIEYAYKPLSGNETEELAKIASRVAEHDLQFGTDEDLYGSTDPRINLYDLGDPLEYAKDRVKLVEAHLQDLAAQVVEKGEGWQRAREAFNMLLGEFSQATYLTAQYVGALYNHRDHREDPNARPPFEPLPVAKQREAIAFLQEHVLSDKAFRFSPELLKRLAPEYWSHWGSSGSSRTEYPVLSQVLGIQRAVLSQFLNSRVLGSIQNVELQAAEGQEVLRMPEVFDGLSQSIWSELPAAGDSSPKKVEITTVRRNLQREHAKRLASIVLGPRAGSMFALDFASLLFIDTGGGSAPADAKSLARHHLRQIDGRIQAALGNSQLEIDTYARAHLEELHDQIAKVMNASLEAGDL